MSACGCEIDESPTGEDTAHEAAEGPWWRDRAIMVPVFSGISLAIGLALEWSGASTAALVAFWIGLLLGASTFVPGAIRKLARGKLGIALLMTISATGAVILGYVGEAAALAFLYSIAEALEDKAMDRARGGLRALLKLVPQTATIIEADQHTEVPARDLVPGQVMFVRPGERVATDGIIRTGHSSVDTSAITGESIAVEVAPGDQVSAGAINISGSLEVTVTAPGTDNSLTTIVKLVESAQAQKGARARMADRIARPLVPGVLILAVLVAVIGSLLGDPELWITRALVVLVAASPCALAISVPITVVAAIGSASEFGVIIKSGAAFERFGAIGHVAFDKTGTLTRNEPTVTRVLTTGNTTEHEVLAWAAALEHHSTHPLGSAIIAAAASPAATLVDPPVTSPSTSLDTSPASAIQLPAGSASPASISPVPIRPTPFGLATAVKELPGHGLEGSIDGVRFTVGSPRWLDPGTLGGGITDLEAQGMTVVVLHRAGQAIGAIGVRDELRPEAPSAIAALVAAGIEVTMLTGDNERTARALAQAAGITDVRAELRPQDKATAIAELAAKGPIAMIGDGINDAPALAAADVGIAMGLAGSDAAIESADIAFTGHDLRLLPRAFDHAKRGHRIMTQNVVLSLAIIIALPPLALTGVLGLAAVVAIHEVAEVVIIINGLRAARTKAPESSAAWDEQSTVRIAK